MDDEWWWKMMKALKEAMSLRTMTKSWSSPWRIKCKFSRRIKKLCAPVQTRSIQFKTRHQTAPTPRQEVPAHVHAAGSNRIFYLPWSNNRPLMKKNIFQADWTHRSFYTENLYTEELSHTNKAYAQNPLPTQAFTYKGSFYTRAAFTHRAAFTRRSFYTQKFLHIVAFTQRRFYTEKLLLLGTI